VSLDANSTVVQRTVVHDAEAEQELIEVLRELVALAGERPGGVTVDELARKLGRDDDRRGVRELLERGRSAVEDPAGAIGRFAVVERVHEDIAAYWRARYVPTSFGCLYLQGIG
jgi:hypothetical protein